MGTKRLQAAAVMLLALSMAGCEGDRGPAGPAGPTGPTGSTGSSGTNASAAVPAASAKIIRAEITGVTIAADTRATVNLTLRNELEQPLKGLPADNLRMVISQLRPGVDGRGAEIGRAHV